MSSGNRQKVGVIQAFMNKRQLIVMDEPSSGLDPLVQREFQKMMREVAADGRSVFLSSHTLSEVQRVADRVGIIRHGLLVDVESVNDLRSKAIRRVELFFDTPVKADEFATVAGVREVKANQHSLVISFDGEMDQLLKVATNHHNLVDITSHEADLEEIFLTYYEDEESEA
jgi:ABC-2 type transport system ATP-binding protein